MTLYYFKLALISIRKNLGHTALMVAAIGLGVSVCMTIVTVNYLMGKDPIPYKSSQLYHVQLDNWDPNRPYDDDRPEDAPEQLTWRDANALMEANKAFRETKSSKFSVVVQPDDPDIKPFQVGGRGTHADFFTMFDTPFLYGGGWPNEADRDLNNSEQVAVLSRETNERVFGGENSVGRDIRLGEHIFRVVGVMDTWDPVPKFYDLNNNPFEGGEDIYIPFNLIMSKELNRGGNTNCWKPTEGGIDAFKASECVWVQYWVELRSQQEYDDYLQFLNSYVETQKETGRFERPMNNYLRDVNEWLENNEVVMGEAKMLLAVAVMFLAVCLLNTIGLLLSKFMGKASEVGVRRALGASRGTLFYQYLIETGLIGVSGGILGLLLTFLGLEAMKSIFGDQAENLMQLDMTLVMTAILLAIVSSIAAGLYPTWRACNISPAYQLKSQ
ncbi:MAG: ABC transporter permease [Pseudomonadota bacterium]